MRYLAIPLSLLLVLEPFSASAFTPKASDRYLSSSGIVQNIVDHSMTFTNNGMLGNKNPSAYFSPDGSVYFQEVYGDNGYFTHYRYLVTPNHTLCIQITDIVYCGYIRETNGEYTFEAVNGGDHETIAEFSDVLDGDIDDAASNWKQHIAGLREQAAAEQRRDREFKDTLGKIALGVGGVVLTWAVLSSLNGSASSGTSDDRSQSYSRDMLERGQDRYWQAYRDRQN